MKFEQTALWCHRHDGTMFYTSKNAVAHDFIREYSERHPRRKPLVMEEVLRDVITLGELIDERVNDAIERCEHSSDNE